MAAAVLEPTHRLAVRLNGMIDGDYVKRSKFSGDLGPDRPAMRERVFQIAMHLIPTWRIEPPTRSPNSNLTGMLLCKNFFGRDYSAHDRIEAISVLPAMLTEGGATPEQIKLWLPQAAT